MNVYNIHSYNICLQKENNTLNFITTNLILYYTSIQHEIYYNIPKYIIQIIIYYTTTDD